MSETCPPPIWRKTNLPPEAASAFRSDDLWFVDPDVGWAVNSNGQILKTTDGGDCWRIQAQIHGPSYLRSVAFGDHLHGWVGRMYPCGGLFHTSDGGENWFGLTNLPAAAPQGFCGLYAASPEVVYGAGTSLPWTNPAIVKTQDGGRSWRAIDMRPHARVIVDLHFLDPDRGWVVGGNAGPGELPEGPPTRPGPPDPAYYANMRPVVLWTVDGGQTWTDQLEGIVPTLPRGEFGWKIQFDAEGQAGYVSLEGAKTSAYLKTTDGGKTWARVQFEASPPARFVQGIGFANEHEGWVGTIYLGASAPPGARMTFETRDGGSTWSPSPGLGEHINRFRFVPGPDRVGYAAGRSIYKYAPHPLATGAVAVSAPAAAAALTPDGESVAIEPPRGTIGYMVPDGAREATLHLWDMRGVYVARCPIGVPSSPGPSAVSLVGAQSAAPAIPAGHHIYRLAIDDHVQSGEVTIPE
jgi:photosystem II stability/assembly factor-like uncharacterized protein